MAQIFVGLGSNLGDRQANVLQAAGRLGDEPGVQLRALSRLYETAPVGVLDQPEFVNAVLQAETDLSPLEVLRTLKRLESELGRQPSRRWGERLIDLDLLLYDQVKLATQELTVPHPRLWERRFVLEPLAELAPGLRSPDGRPIQRVVAELARDQGLHLLESSTT